MLGLMRSERVRVPTSYCRYVKTVDMSLDLHTSRYPESRQFIPCLLASSKMVKTTQRGVAVK